MKSLAVSVLTAAVLIGVFSVGSRGQVASQEKSAGPGRSDSAIGFFRQNPIHSRVSDPRAAARHLAPREVDAASSPVPGGLPQAPLWINTASPFAVQEWTCKG